VENLSRKPVDLAAGSRNHFRNECPTNERLILRAAKNARLRLAKLNLLGQNPRIAPDQSRAHSLHRHSWIRRRTRLPFRFRLKFSHRA